MTALYSIAEQYAAILARLADEPDESMTEALGNALDEVGGDLQDKLRAVLAYALSIEAEAEQINAAMKRMSLRAERLERQAERMREYALMHARACGIAEVKTPEWAAKIARKPPSVEIVDASALPASFLRVPEPPAPTPDKRALLEALKAGGVVPGAKLAAPSFRWSVK